VKKHKSFIIIIEGIDASGKNTLSKALEDHFTTNAEAFQNNGYRISEVLSYQFPDYNGLTGKILKKLLDAPIPDIETIASIFALDRKLANTNDDDYYIIKIFDRYYPSNLVYNYNLGLKHLMELEKDSYVGDVVFLLDVSPEESFRRRPERRDNYENDRENLMNIRNRYLELARKFGWVILDGRKNTTELVEDIVVHCCYRMNKGLVNTFHEEE